MNDINGLDSPRGLRLKFGDLAPNGVALSEEEIRAVSGGLWVVSWKCTPKNLDDEWVVK